MNTRNAVRRIAALDLDQIKTKLMHQQSGEGWSAARADAMEAEYRRFLCMMLMHPRENFAPLIDVDTFWHYHILDTRKYAADCAQVFGYFLHHNPVVGLGDSALDAAEHAALGARMHALYQASFGAGCATATAWCSLAVSAATVQPTAWPAVSAGGMQAAPAWRPVMAANDPAPTAWCSRHELDRGEPGMLAS